jgi:hypothetical protein
MDVPSFEDPDSAPHHNDYACIGCVDEEDLKMRNSKKERPLIFPTK